MANVSRTLAAIPILKAVAKRFSSLEYVKVELQDGHSYATATNLDTYVSVRVDDGTAPGLYKIIGKELVSFTSDSVKLSDFPDDKEWTDGGTSFLLPVAALKATIPFAETSRRPLNSLMVQVHPSANSAMQIVATDGHRLRIQHTYDPTAINLPEESVQHLLRQDACVLVAKFAKTPNVRVTVNATVNVSAYGMGVRYDTAEFTLFSRKESRDDFPNYLADIPSKFPRQFSVNRAEFIAALKAIKPFTARSKGALFHFMPNGKQLEISAKIDGCSKTITMDTNTLTGVHHMDLSRQLDRCDGIAALRRTRLWDNYRPDGYETKVGSLELNVAHALTVAETVDGELLYIGYKTGEYPVAFAGKPLSHGETGTAEEIQNDIQNEMKEIEEAALAAAEARKHREEVKRAAAEAWKRGEEDPSTDQELPNA